MSYLPDDILTKVDRMSMACSLEVRVPLLDHRVVEFMAQIDRKHKFTQFRSKVLLRELAGRYLPQWIRKRPKQGFAIPLASWLQGPLRPWLEDMLFSKASVERGLFKSARLRQMFDDHLSNRRDYSQQLWALGLLEMWLDQQGHSRD